MEESDGTSRLGEPIGTDAELEERRTKVLSLRLRRLTQKDIATALNIDQSTVSRDLAWVATNWRGLYGGEKGAQIDATQEIGEAIAVFSEMEATAIRDMTKLKIDQSKQRNAYMRTILISRQMRINLLQDLGFIDRRVGEMNITLRADSVRNALREEGLLSLERGRLPTIEDGEDHEDEIERWLRKVE